MRLHTGSCARVAAAAMLAVMALTAMQEASPQAAVQRPDGLYAEVQTAKGLIVIQLRPDVAPMAVANFVGLAEGTIENSAFDLGHPYFDNSTFHRVVPGHVIQTGVPNSARAKEPGYQFPNEIDARMSHDHAGAVNMANAGPNTNASQWCITLGNRSYLDGDFTIFGEVVQGLDVVLKIQQDDALNSIHIVRVGATAEAYHPTTASFRALVAAANQRVAAQVELKRKAEQDWVKANYPNAVGAAGDVEVVNVSDAKPDAVSGAAAGPLRLHYSGREMRYAGGWTGRQGPPMVATAFGSGDNGVPGFNDPPREFAYEKGTTKLNPGLEPIVESMHPGDHRIVIVPAEHGYGEQGLYPPGTPGKPRFIVSPNAMMVYDIEALPNPQQ